MATYVRFKTRTNSTTFTDAQILALLKVRRDEITAKLLEADENLFTVPYTENLVANQRQYPFQNDFLRLVKVEAKLDGTNFIVLKEMEIGRHDKPTDETNITYYFANLEGEAYYEKIHQGIYIYSGTITNVTNGLKTKYVKEAAVITDLTSTTDMAAALTNTTHGLPKPIHELLARGVCIDYKESREKPIPLTEREGKYEYDLQKAIEKIKHGNLDREIVGQLPPKEDRGDDGADY